MVIHGRTGRMAWLFAVMTVGAAAVLLGVGGTPAASTVGGAAQPETLPILELAPPDTARRELLALARSVGLAEPVLRQRGERWVYEEDSLVAEWFAASGGVWIADRARLWNPDLRPHLLDTAATRVLADRALAVAARLSGSQDSLVRWVATPGHTVMVRFQRRPLPGRIERVLLDRHITYQAWVRISGSELPVVGGGGKFTVALGDSGALIAVSGVWRPVTRVAGYARLVPRAVADSQFAALTRGLHIDSVSATLAYYSAPAGLSQQYLYPVWVYSAEQLVEGERVEMRSVVIPATTYGTALPPPKADAGLTTASPPCPGSPNPGKRENSSGTKAPPFEAGAAWINLGLPHANANARGFLSALGTVNWVANFERRGPEACMSHWVGLDDQWVDAADFVFYTGHTKPGGWQLNPDNRFLRHTVVGPAGQDPGDLWGESDLEWLLIAACGPLQDAETGEAGSDVFERWGGAFDGLHLLMGYGSRSFDNPWEGRTVVRYALEGEPLGKAWLRTAREIQAAIAGGKRVWAGVMYPYKDGVDPYHDRLWGTGPGPVSPDVYDPDGFVGIWTSI